MNVVKQSQDRGNAEHVGDTRYLKPCRHDYPLVSKTCTTDEMSETTFSSPIHTHSITG